jgi:hypothetical protein
MRRVAFRFPSEDVSQGRVIFRYRINEQRSTMIAAQGSGHEVTFDPPYSILLVDEMLRGTRMVVAIGGLFDAAVGQAEFHLNGLREMLKDPDARCAP